jgi:uncharacterized protein (UPF0261 family)
MPDKASVWVVGTWDTKAQELDYLCALLRGGGVAVTAVDVSTSAQGGDRGAAVTAESQKLCARVKAQADRIAGMLGVGGSGGTSLIAPAMRLLPIGRPKLLVSTLASGDVSPFVGVSDISMMFPVTDIAGLNRLSRTILANAAHAMAGMVQNMPPPASADELPALGCTMFGVTTPCVQALRGLLADRFGVQVFHANGSGGRAMEALAASGMLQAIVDVTTTEVLQNIVGGVCDAGPGRLAAAYDHGLPWVGSVGALDMVNWFAPGAIPERFRHRTFHPHNANVTLMRTTADELREAGRVIAERLNRSPGPVRLLLPLGGLSALDAPGQPFHDPGANAALFETLERCFRSTDTHRLTAVPAHINDAAFSEALAEEVLAVVQ